MKYSPKPNRFPALNFPLEPRPEWWKVRPAEIIDLCEHVKIGKTETIAETTNGYPVYAVFYGDFSETAPQTNWSAGSASGKAATYAPKGGPQTILFVAGIHGAEAESVAAMVNLIRMLETGRDFRGKADPEFEKLIGHYRLIIVPCVNMDARAISPDHLRNASKDQFNLASQGLWKDGSPISWLGSKEYFPLPLDRVQFPGGYPNAAGVNIMHDASGTFRSAEAAALVRLCERYRVDCVLNGHSCSYPPSVIDPSRLNYAAHIRLGEAIRQTANEKLQALGLRSCKAIVHGGNFTLNLNTQMMLASGALALTLECNVSSRYLGDDACIQTFEEMIEPNYILLKTAMEYGLEIPLCDRDTLMKYGA